MSRAHVVAAVTKDDGLAFLALVRRVAALYGWAGDIPSTPTELRNHILSLGETPERDRTDVLRSLAANATDGEWAVAERVLCAVAPVLPRDVPLSLREFAASRRDPAWIARVEVARLVALQSIGGAS